MNDDSPSSSRLSTLSPRLSESQATATADLFMVAQLPLASLPAQCPPIFVTAETQRTTWRTECRVPSDGPFTVALGPIPRSTGAFTLRVVAGQATQKFSLNECIAAGTSHTSAFGWDGTDTITLSLSANVKLNLVPLTPPDSPLAPLALENMLTRSFVFLKCAVVESAGQVPFANALVVQVLEAHSARAQCAVDVLDGLVRRVRAAHGLFKSAEEASRFGFVAVGVRVVAARQLAQVQRRPLSVTLSNAFVQVFVLEPSGRTRPLGRTNTEYRSADPVFGTNANVRACEHANPATSFSADKFGRMRDASCVVGYARPGDELLFQVVHERFGVKTGITHHAMCAARIAVAALPSEPKARTAELALCKPGARDTDDALGSLFVAAFADEGAPSSNPFDGPMSEDDVVTLAAIPPRWAQRVLAVAQENYLLLAAWTEYSSHWQDSFKSSQLKSDVSLGCLPTNLHQGAFVVKTKDRAPAIYATTTIGAPAAHCIGLRFEGLAQLQALTNKLAADARAGERLDPLHLEALVVGRELGPGVEIGVPCVEKGCGRDAVDCDDSCGAHSHVSSTAGRSGFDRGDTRERVASLGRTVLSNFAQRFGPSSTSAAVSSAAAAVTLSPSVSPTKALSHVAPWQQCIELALTLRIRETVVLCQALPMLASAFATEALLAVARRDVAWGAQVSREGFLLGWESLVSTHGKELVMLEDMLGACELMSKLGLVAVDAPDGVVRASLESDSVLRVAIPGIGSIMPVERALGNVRMRVLVVLFTQGINEKQSLANATDAESTLVQGRINAASLAMLERYAKDTGASAQAWAVLHNLKVAVAQTQSNKNVEVLLLADDAVRALRGGRAISCKSGKDRTAMAITLEQSRWAGLAPSDGAANLFREFGVRLRIAEKNIGKALYSFNKLQRSFLPDEYRPPVSTIQDLISSWSKSDT